MKIELLEFEHLSECATLLRDAYNCAPWDNHWSEEASERYLKEFLINPRFVGYVICEDSKIVGAAFCHEKTWWTNDELFVDEFYISPDFQRKGYGNILLKHIEKYIEEKKLAGFTLLTNRYMPAVNFYEKNGFVKAEHVVFMYKEV
jgi:aminoglycoside 6'-N-acetyltransferase I